ncbi:electron transfer flavoprotein subunit alpha/FixB family protein [Paraburkholderia caballeronis]|uniref:Electron transfer flavoprotein subunit alpha n=1 Tax=Paraburkholderia caballeronis TaxID=416943 RepID=A0A1H7VAR7_9BURK|nr:electron transfer flavoprotein subunit alpha/FixB family protein [Paraburkholderia caballeronis]PXW16501.1 electron transfer flavoprotein alpha subunit apoprotein [Paraburkholderia caballeronis]PXW94222.1 electron transfer flavoprotein alpha subunit apoprotein [Paraburkholderia caballeronis]RAJ89751.1 electron transfer flavoprotein alpha subunit apoprotein [Paraburkholderia caballeronis]TDV27852.1 electron transfer flavoprotein alpha subunit apoprotein [Paraburkholderia caballeronis]SED9449
MKTLVLAELDHGSVSETTLRAVTAAAQRGAPVDLLVFDAQSAEPAAQVAGIERVLVAQAGAPDTLTPETIARQLRALAGDYSTIVAAHRTPGRGALPRAAALTGAAFVADVIAFPDSTHVVRGLYAGSVLATVATGSVPLFATIRASSFAPASATGGAAGLVTLDPVEPFGGTRLVERRAAGQSGRDLSSARFVVSGGRGLGSKENMERLGNLADRLGAALGASRAAVDAGYAPNTAQVGQTGKIVAPDVYLAFGISGAIQHLAGMKDAKLIVAVNKDPDAPIFSVADIGVVGDLFDVVGQLEARIGAVA